LTLTDKDAVLDSERIQIGGIVAINQAETSVVSTFADELTKGRVEISRQDSGAPFVVRGEGKGDRLAGVESDLRQGGGLLFRRLLFVLVVGEGLDGLAEDRPHPEAQAGGDAVHDAETDDGGVAVDYDLESRVGVVRVAAIAIVLRSNI
jgi:hypothetical protein